MRARSLVGALLLATVAVAVGCDKAQGDSIALTNRGVRAYEAGEIEMAADYFITAIQTFPQNASAYYHLALLQRYDRGDVAGARKSLEVAYQLNPDDPDTCFQLGVMLFEEDKLDTAQAHFDRALQKDPQLYHAHFQLGQLFAKKSKFTEADASYRRAIQLYPVYAPAYEALGQLYLDFGEFEAAVAVLSEGTRLIKDEISLYTTLGLVHMERGDYPAAIAAFSQALAIDPDNNRSFFNLGLAYERAGDSRQAIELLEKFVERARDGEQTEVALAKAVMTGLFRELDTRTRKVRQEIPPPPPEPAPPVDGGTTAP